MSTRRQFLARATASLGGAGGVALGLTTRLRAGAVALSSTATLSACGPGGRIGFESPVLRGVTGVTTRWSGGVPERLDHGALRGQVVLLNLWATWCAPCVHELPVLNDLHERLFDRGLRVLGWSEDPKSDRATVEAAVRTHALTYPILFGEPRRLTGFDTEGYPATALIGRDGATLWTRTGMVLPNDAELTPLLERALAT